MTYQQFLLRLFMEENYHRLINQYQMKDMMHEAFITVFHTRRHIEPSMFERLIVDAYHRHCLREINHRMHYVMPDPLFWYLQEQNETDDPINQFFDMLMSESTNRQQQEQEEHISDELRKKIFRYVRDNVSHQDYHIFTLFFNDNKPIPLIAEIIGLSKKECVERIEYLSKLIQRYASHNITSSNTAPKSTTTKQNDTQKSSTAQSNTERQQ